MKLQAVIFDLDDTLYPEQSYVLSGFTAVAAYMEQRASFAAKQTFAELQALFVKGIRGNTFELWLEQHDLACSVWLPQLVEHYRTHTPSLKPYEGVPHMLVALRARYKVALLSDGYLAVQQGKLAALDLAHHFDTIAFSDTWGRAAWKPSPIPYNHVLNELAMPAASAVYIGDNPHKDFLGARAADMKSIWLHRDEGEYSRVVPASSQHVPDFEVSDIASLQSLLQAMDS